MLSTNAATFPFRERGRIIAKSDKLTKPAAIGLLKDFASIYMGTTLVYDSGVGDIGTIVQTFLALATFPVVNPPKNGDKYLGGYGWDGTAWKTVPNLWVQGTTPAYRAAAVALPAP